MSTNLARLLRIIADGREEHAHSLSAVIDSLQVVRDVLFAEAAAFRSAALLAEGHIEGLSGLLPTWRLTPEVKVLAEQVRIDATPAEHYRSDEQSLTSAQRNALVMIAERDYVNSGQRNDRSSNTCAWGTLNALRRRGFVDVEHVARGRIARITPEGREELNRG